MMRTRMFSKLAWEKVHIILYYSVLRAAYAEYRSPCHLAWAWLVFSCHETYRMPTCQYFFLYEAKETREWNRDNLLR
jgi:hypothetical protein